MFWALLLSFHSYSINILVDGVNIVLNVILMSSCYIILHFNSFFDVLGLIIFLRFFAGEIIHGLQLGWVGVSYTISMI